MRKEKLVKEEDKGLIEMKVLPTANQNRVEVITGV